MPEAEIASPERRRGRPAVGLGELQAAVMAELWDAGEASTREVVARLASRGAPLAHTTVLTTLVRLRERGLVTRTRAGRTHRYRPAVDRDELAAALSREAIDRLLAAHGDAAVSAFADRMREGDPRDLERLRDLLDHEGR